MTLFDEPKAEVHREGKPVVVGEDAVGKLTTEDFCEWEHDAVDEFMKNVISP